MKYSGDVIGSETKVTCQGCSAMLSCSSSLRAASFTPFQYLMHVFVITPNTKKKMCPRDKKQTNSKTDEWVKNGSIRYTAELLFLLHQQNKVQQEKVGMDPSSVESFCKKIVTDRIHLVMNISHGSSNGAWASSTVQDSCCSSEWGHTWIMWRWARSVFGFLSAASYWLKINSSKLLDSGSSWPITKSESKGWH